MQRKHRSTSTAREGAVPLLQGLLLVTLLLVGFLTTRDFVPTYAHFAVSLSLFLVGVSLRLLAIKTMCGFFLDGVRLREDHTLVTTGLYAFVRHPSEVGTFCILCGFATLSQSSWLVAGLAFCWVPFACWRIGREEQLLLKRFQGEFLNYKARTSRFFPGFF